RRVALSCARRLKARAWESADMRTILPWTGRGARSGEGRARPGAALSGGRAQLVDPLSAHTQHLCGLGSAVPLLMTKQRHGLALASSRALEHLPRLLLVGLALLPDAAGRQVCGRSTSPATGSVRDGDL